MAVRNGGRLSQQVYRDSAMLSGSSSRAVGRASLFRSACRGEARDSVFLPRNGGKSEVDSF